MTAEDGLRTAIVSESTDRMCSCGHPASAHANEGRCQEWRRYPEVLNARQCGCTGTWNR